MLPFKHSCLVLVKLPRITELRLVTHNPHRLLATQRDVDDSTYIIYTTPCRWIALIIPWLQQIFI